MGRVRAIAKKILYPKGILLGLLVPLSAVCLWLVFSRGRKDTLPACLIYTLSAYTLTAVALRTPRWIRRGRALLLRIPLLRRYLSDLDFRAEIALRLTFGVSLFYAVYKALAGAYYRSVWLGAMAFYYALLATARFLLLRHLGEERQDDGLAFRKYRLCGWLLLVLALSIISMGAYLYHGRQRIVSPGYAIYGAAAYTFYNLSLAIVNVVRYKKRNNPIHSASKILSLVTALVSLFFLQTAMLAVFSSDGPWQRRMNLWTGILVYTIISGTALYMIGRGSRAIRRMKKAPPEH